MVIGSTQFSAAFCTSASDNGLATLGGHAATKTSCADTFDFTGLVSTFHFQSPKTNIFQQDTGDQASNPTDEKVNGVEAKIIFDRIFIG